MKLRNILSVTCLSLFLLLAGFSTEASAQRGALVGQGCEEFIKGTEILYFPTKQLAIDMYNAALRQGDCAKTWDAGSEGWAIQVKPVLWRNPGNRGGKAKPVAPEPYAKLPEVGTSSLGKPGVLPRRPSYMNRLVTRPFTNRVAADAVFRSRMQSEGWAQMWYEPDKKIWIVATKR